MKKSTRLIITAAAMAGLYAGSFAARTFAADDTTAGTPDQSKAQPSAKHDCKGKNDCKGAGNCSAGDQGCAGKNSCKGKGGCASKDDTKTNPPSDGSSAPSGGTTGTSSTPSGRA